MGISEKVQMLPLGFWLSKENVKVSFWGEPKDSKEGNPWGASSRSE